MPQTWPLPEGFRLHCHPSLPSTNDEAMRLAAAGAPHGTAVLADRQEAGRGRQGRPWHSPTGGLYLSVVLRPGLIPERQRHLPLAAGLALREALETSCGLAAGLKWPNDIFLSGAKLAGILIENVPGVTGGPGGFAVVGLGVNLTGEAAELSRALARPVTSLAAVSGRQWRARELASPILAALERWFRLLATEGAPALLSAWRRHDVCLGRQLSCHLPDGTIVRGVALGLDDSGAYLIAGVGGKVVPVLAGDLLPGG